jgi:hypothetical protein
VTSLASRLRLFFLSALLLAVGAVLVLAACGGGGGNSKDATQLLDTAFKHPIKSADVNLSLQLQVDGVPSLKNPISFKVSGPYVNNGGAKLPSLDLKASLIGGGQSVPFGLTSTGDNFFVTVQGTPYEVGKARVAQVNAQLAKQSKSNQRTTFSDLGINPLSWLRDAKEEGDDNVAGTDVTHVSAALDVGKLLDDLNRVVAKAPTGGLSGTKPQQLTAKQKSQIQKVVKSPHLDVYVAKSDQTVRRLATKLDIQIPKDQQAQFNGATGGTVQFSIDFANVGGNQQIAAPKNAKPIADLASQLNALGGQLGGSSGSGGSSNATPTAPSTGSAPDVKKFEDYSRCVQKAGSNNVQAIQKCAEILNK